MNNKRRALGRKYKLRRMMLIILAILVVLTIGLLIGSRLGGEKDNTPLGDSGKAVETNRSQPSNAADTAEAMVATQSQPEPEPQSQPELTSTPEPLTNEEGWELIVVSAQSPIPENYKVDLEWVSGDYKVDSRIVIPFKQMIAAAKSDGINIQLFSAYRDPVKQEELFKSKMAEHVAAGKSQEQAYADTIKWIAYPWTSEHHTGLAVDISTPEAGINRSFEDTAAFDWLSKNARDYGFVLRYPEGKEEITGIQYEPWHYRYVGVDVARVIWENKYTLEEYIYHIQHKTVLSGVDLEDASDEETSDGTSETSQTE